MRIQHCGTSAVRSLAVALAVAALVAWSGTAEAGIVTDGGFEADTAFAAPNSPWNSTGGVFIDNTLGLFHSGGQDAAFPDGGTLSQQLPTVHGQSYVLDFWVLDDTPDPSNTLTVTLGTFFTASIAGDTASSYFEFNQTVDGSQLGDNDTLSFAATEADGTDWHLDDVSVTPVTTAVPEPASIALLGIALAGYGFFDRRRRRYDGRSWR